MNPPLMEQLPHKNEVLREWLRAEAPDAGDETLRDNLGKVNDLHAAIACVIRAYLDDLMLAAALGIRLEEMQNRLTRLEARAERKRLLVTSVMEQAEMREMREPDFGASLRRTLPSLIVTDESTIPAIYWKPQPPKLDEQGLTSALRGGDVIPGAKLGSGYSALWVRTK